MDKNEILNSDYDVRYFAAGNLATPADVLTELAKDSDCDVRYFAAGNPATPADVLTELAKDIDYDVCRNAACNPKLKEVLTDKNKSDED